MKSLELATHAAHRLELAEDKDWWNNQTEKFKKKYIELHPTSKYAKMSRRGKKSEVAPTKNGQKTLKQPALKKKTFDKLKSTDPDFTKKSSYAVRKLLNAKPEHIDEKYLHHVDDVLFAKETSFKKNEERIDKIIHALNKKLLKAPDHQRSSINAEIRSATKFKNQIRRDIESVQDKRKKLEKKHPTHLAKKNAERDVKEKMLNLREIILSDKKNLEKLKDDVIKLRTKIRSAKGPQKESLKRQYFSVEERIASTRDRLTRAKGYLK